MNAKGTQVEEDGKGTDAADRRRATTTGDNDRRKVSFRPAMVRCCLTFDEPSKSAAGAAAGDDASGDRNTRQI